MGHFSVSRAELSKACQLARPTSIGGWILHQFSTKLETALRYVQITLSVRSAPLAKGKSQRAHISSRPSPEEERFGFRVKAWQSEILRGILCVLGARVDWIQAHPNNTRSVNFAHEVEKKPFFLAT